MLFRRDSQNISMLQNKVFFSLILLAALLLSVQLCQVVNAADAAEDTMPISSTWDDDGTDTDRDEVPEADEDEPAGIEIGNPDFIIEGGEEGIIKRALDYLFLIGIVIVPLLVLVGAFMFFTSGGDPTRTAKAKALILWAVIGLAILLFAKAIMSIIKSLLDF